MHTFNIKRIVILICVAAALLSQSACGGTIYSNYREVDTMQLVQTLGVDEDLSGPRITVSTGGYSTSETAVIISRPGKSVVSAMESIKDYSAKEELYFAHTHFVLIGEPSARVRFSEILDYVQRNTRIRMNAIPAIINGGDAESLIRYSGGENYEVTEALTAIERDIKRTGDSYPYSFREVSRSLFEYGSALVCSVASKKTEGTVFSESGELTVVPSGYGIIKDGYLIGFLDIDEAKGANVLTGKFRFGAIDLSFSSGEHITLLPEDSKASFTASFDDAGKLRQVLCEIKISAGMNELSVPADLNDPAFSQAINSALSKEVESWCAAALLRSIEEESDFLGLKGLLRKRYPLEITELSEPFTTALKNAEVSLHVTGTVKHDYNLDEPISFQGEDS